MASKRKAADAVAKDTKKVKAGGDIRNFFSSQGSSPPKRMTRQDSASKAAKQVLKTEKEDEEIAARMDATIEPPTTMLTKAIAGAKDMDVVKSTSKKEAAMEASEKIPKEVITEYTTPKEKTTEAVEKPLSKEEEDSEPSFDKKAWADANLTEEQKELLGLEIQTLEASWFEVLKDELKSKSFLDLKRFLMQEHKSGKTIFPPAEDVYSWSRHTPLKTVKAVILGQDPYHNHNQAHGLCKSCVLIRFISRARGAFIYHINNCSQEKRMSNPRN